MQAGRFLQKSNDRESGKIDFSKLVHKIDLLSPDATNLSDKIL